MRNGGPRIMADDNPVARINSQIFQSRDIKGCKLHFWSNAPGGCTVQQFQPGLGEGEQGGGGGMGERRGGEGRGRGGELERGWVEGWKGRYSLSSSARTGIIVLLTK